MDVLVQVLVVAIRISLHPNMSVLMMEVSVKDATVANVSTVVRYVTVTHN